MIDCTGDADIAHLSGCAYIKTKKEDMMGVTTVFNCKGIDKEKFLKYNNKKPSTYKDWDSDDWK